MTYQDAIDFIYANRLPKEDYSATLKRLKHPLATRLYDIPGHCQQLSTAVEQYNKEEKAEADFDHKLNLVSMLHKGENVMTLDEYTQVKDSLPVIQYAFTDPVAKTVRLRLL